MKDRILPIYDNNTGPNILFLKYIKSLNQTYGYIFDGTDRLEKIKNHLKDEFDAVLLFDDLPKIVFKNKESKMFFMIKFN